MSAVIRAAALWLERGSRVVMATVIDGGTGNLLESGCQRAINDAGTAAGSLGDEVLDEIVSRQAQALMADGETRVLTFPEAGEACVFLERVDERRVINRLIFALDEGEACAWVTDLTTGLACTVSNGLAQGSLGLDRSALVAVGSLMAEAASATLSTGLESSVFVRTYKP
ncbi:MAG: XdhC family protein [Rhodospirillales bacterium]